MSAAKRATVVALVKPVPLETPRVGREGIVAEGMAWGLAAGERAAVAHAATLAQALDAELVALACGPADMEPGLREALALGARRAVRVDPGERAAALDAALTARALAKAAQRFPGPLVVVAGEASADEGQGLVGGLVAAHLGLELLPSVQGVEAGADGIVATVDEGAQVARWKLTPPFALTVAARGAKAAHPTSWGVGEAFRLPLEVVPLADLGLGEEAKPLVQVASLRRAEAKRERAEVHEGDAGEQAAQLHRRLRAQGVIR